ncbi:MAG: hypothetical protein ACRC8S_17300 [Fimbriiglobus sp.]
MPDEVPPKKPLDFDWFEAPKPPETPAKPALELTETAPVDVPLVEILPEAKPIAAPLPEAKPVSLAPDIPTIPTIRPKVKAPVFPEKRPASPAQERPAPRKEKPPEKKIFLAMFLLASLFLGFVIAVLVLMWAIVTGFQQLAPKKQNTTPTTLKAEKTRDRAK